MEESSAQVLDELKWYLSKVSKLAAIDDAPSDLRECAALLETDFEVMYGAAQQMTEHLIIFFGYAPAWKHQLPPEISSQITEFMAGPKYSRES